MYIIKLINQIIIIKKVLYTFITQFVKILNIKI